MKKGNLLGEPFVYILALVAMALVITFGVKSVNDVVSISDDVELTDFIVRLQDEVKIFQNFDVGSFKTVKFGLPSKIDRVCFLNPELEVDVPGMDSFLTAIMENSIKNNVFIEPLDSFSKTDYYVESLWVDIDENPLCFLMKDKSFLEFGIETIVENNEVVVAVRRDLI